MMTVLYRDLPKYNDRRRNLWLPEVIHQHHQGLRRSMSNPNLYGLNESSSRYSAHVQNSTAWCNGSSGEASGMQRHWVDSTIRPLSMSSSTASFPSNHCTLLSVCKCYCIFLILYKYILYNTEWPKQHANTQHFYFFYLKSTWQRAGSAT